MIVPRCVDMKGSAAPLDTKGLVLLIIELYSVLK